MTTALVIGLGRAGLRHSQALKRVAPGTRVVGLSEHLDEADSVDKVVNSLDDAIKEKPSVAVLAGPAPGRAELAMLLADEGIHLFLEKPVDTTTEHLYRLRDRAEKRKLTVGVGYNLRHFEPVALVRELAINGVIGELWSASLEVGADLREWRPGTDYRNSISARADRGGGALNELSHELDLAIWTLGAARSVSASIRTTGQLEADVDDCVDLLVEFDNVEAAIHLDLLQRPPRRSARFIGSNGSAAVDLLAGTVTVLTHDPWETRTVSTEGQLLDTYDAQLDDFLRAVSSGGSPLVPLIAGIETVELMEAARESASDGRRVSLRPSRPAQSRAAT